MGQGTSSFDELVESVRNGIKFGMYVDCLYGTSKAKQRFAILITKLQLIMDEDHKEYSIREGKRSVKESVYIQQSWPTIDEICKAANKIKSCLEKGDFNLLTSYSRERYRIRIMPRDCAKNPDKYLKKGDLIATDYLYVINHEGIYIGNGKVIHVSGHGQGKSASVVRIGNLNGDFVYSDDATIRVVVYPMHFKTKTEIVKCALNWANLRFREGEYNLLKRNCQHFARLCVINAEVSRDIQKLCNNITQGIVVSGGLFLIYKGMQLRGS